MASEIQTVDQLLKQGIDVFNAEYRYSPDVAGIAPGRVNLIGEHTDYNEGFVFPMALPMVTIVLGAKNNSDKCRLLSTNPNITAPYKVEFPVPTELDPLTVGEPAWANYVKGIVQYFDGPKIGFDAVIVSSVPLGDGLSSSAALEVSAYSFLEGLTGHKTDLKEKALLCQKAEHTFGLVPCGLMDQLISIYGEEARATLIDCRSLDIQSITIPKSNCVFLIINSNVHHELASSEYSDRRQTCEKVAKILEKKSLRDVTLAELNELNSSNFLDDKMYRRAHHVITENQRTLQACKALESNSLIEFGTLMNQSHDSLSKDYEVSCKELDFLVKTVRQIPGVHGSRMTGGGFGGCTVSLVEKSSVDDVISKVRATYEKKADFYVVTPSLGATVIKLQ